MNAIDLLKSQHRHVERLFVKIESARATKDKQDVFEALADNLVAHAMIEETQFYPAIKAKRTHDIVLESLAEHLGIKRVLADLLRVSADHVTFDAKLEMLKEQVEHHVAEEERDLFPKVSKVLDGEELEALGQQMTVEFEMVAGGTRRDVPSETDHAAAL